ncbi:hypothetical protein ACFLVC_00185 [Chloroflexota bacterium]
MKTYLVEEFNSDIEFDKNSLIIALTPEVCYQLDKEEIKYSIIEDYYDEAVLSNQVDEHRQSVFHWIDELDKFPQNNIRELDLRLGTIYKWYLKGMILDPLYIRCYTLKRLFEAVSPSEVIFIASEPNEPNLNYRFENSGRSLYAEVIPILCGENSIPLKTVFLKRYSKKVREIAKSTGSRNQIFIFRLKSILARSRIVRRIYFIVKCTTKLLFTKRAELNKLNIFMLRSDYIGEDFIIDALTRGHNIYMLSGDSILKYSHLGARRHLNLKVEYDKVAGINNGIWGQSANLLEGHDLIKWFNEQFQLDVSEIVLPRLRYFISNVCPEILGYFKALTKFYKKEQTDILLAPFRSTLIEYAAVAAANYHERVKTVCFSHGDSVSNSKTWNIVELENFNIYIASNTETKVFYSCLGKTINSLTKLYSSPHRLLNVKKIGHLREKRRGKIRKNRIIYLPTFTLWDNRRMDGGPYPDTWNYKFQKSLIEYFSTRREYTFVWKGLPQSEKIYNPIPDFIKDNNFSNIEVAVNSFSEHLLSADRVICDLPSTGFYEAVIAGVPTMSLCYKALIVRKSAEDYFENLLKFFSDIPEAIKYIDEFLNSDSELYKVTIELEDNSILNILEGATNIDLTP